MQNIGAEQVIFPKPAIAYYTVMETGAGCNRAGAARAGLRI